MEIKNEDKDENKKVDKIVNKEENMGKIRR